MALTALHPHLAADLPAHYAYLLTCPDHPDPASPDFPSPALDSRAVDTLAHLPLLHSLPGDILEIGCDCGNSTTAFLTGPARSVTSIDINPLCAENFPDSAKWRFILGDSRDRNTISQVSGQQFDILFIDGDHSYEAAASDLHVYSQLIRPGGLVLVHDVLAHQTFPGVFRAFSDFCPPLLMRAKYVLPGSYGLGVIEL